MAQTDKQQFEGIKQYGLILTIIIFFFDIYFYCYKFFLDNGLAFEYVTRFTKALVSAKIFAYPINTKIAVIVLSVITIMLDKGKKTAEVDKKTIIYASITSTLFFLSVSLVPLMTRNIVIYSTLLLGSYYFVVKYYSLINRLFNTDIFQDKFNKKNKIFPQMTEKIENELSVNIPYKFIKEYKVKKGKFIPILEDGYINMVAPTRASIILGKPGSGKSHSFIEEIIKQHIQKGFAFINYDYKFPTLTNVAYNYFNSYKEAYTKYENGGRFAVINIDDPRYSDRCNPLHPSLLERKSQAMDAIKTIFFNLDKKSASKPDFFQLSAMAISSAVLWFLRIYENGRYCSFPHLIEFIQQPDEIMLSILDSYEELKYFTAAFSDALKKESFEQLSGQTASARIPLGQCATDEMFYVMTDPDNTGVNLRVNDKKNVTFLNIANNPDTQQTNAPALGLYMSTAAKLINAQGRVPCNFNVDELPTIFINGLNNLIATGRSNKVCVTLSVQDYTQLVMNYGKEIADSIFNTIDNVLCGKVAIETAEKITKAIGKFNYQNQSLAMSENNSTTISTQRDFIVPSEDIAQLSQGEFVGIVSDTFKQPIDLKAFRGFVSPSKEDLNDKQYPMINSNITQEVLSDNAKNIREDIQRIVKDEMARLEKIKQKEIEQNELEALSNVNAIPDISTDFLASKESENIPEVEEFNLNMETQVNDEISDQIVEQNNESEFENALDCSNPTPNYDETFASLLSSIEPLTYLDEEE